MVFNDKDEKFIKHQNAAMKKIGELEKENKRLQERNLELVGSLQQQRRFRMEDAADAQGDQLILAEANRKLKDRNKDLIDLLKRMKNYRDMQSIKNEDAKIDPFLGEIIKQIEK